MKIYISGPMTGLFELNFPAFYQCEKRIHENGHAVVNPARLNVLSGGDWAQCMRKDIAELLTCDAIAMLQGWEKSKGALLERHIAESLGMVILAEADFE